MNKIKDIITIDKDNFLRFLEIVVLSSLPVLVLSFLIFIFGVRVVFLNSDLTCLAFAINAGIFMERNGIYCDASSRDFAMIFPFLVGMFCLLCLFVLFLHKHDVNPLPFLNNSLVKEYFDIAFLLLNIFLIIISVLSGMVYALQSRLRF